MRTLAAERMLVEEVDRRMKEAAMRGCRVPAPGSFIAVVALVAALLVPAEGGAATKDPAWVRTFAPANAAVGTSIALDPTGATVYLGGSTQAAPNRLLVRAYATDTGERRWFSSTSCSSKASHPCWLGSVGVSPDGGTVYVTGVDQTGTDSSTWVTMALDSTSGVQRWAARIVGGPTGTSRLVVSPVGDRIFVAGSVGTYRHPGERVVAYDAATGGVLWRHREPGRSDVAYLAVSPDGTLVFAPPVADRSPARDIALAALDAVTGSTVWLRRSGGKMVSDWPAGLAIGQRGNMVFLTDYREAFREPIGRAPLTVAYRASDGKHLWTKTEDAFSAASTMAIPIATGGGCVFLTDGDQTVARSVGSGRSLWTRSTSPGIPWWSYSWGVAVSPRADRLFVFDALCDEATFGHCWLETVALDAATGRVRWTARRAHGAGAGLVVGPSGGRVFVGGWVADDYSAFLGMLVIAYRA